MTDTGDCLRLMKGMTWRQPAEIDEIRRVERELGLRLPEDYIVVMRHSNGAEGAIGLSGYLVLWPIEEIIALNHAYAVDEFAPGLTLFGTDGGDTGYAFARTTVAPGTTHVVRVPLTGLSVGEAVEVGSNLLDLLLAEKRR